MRSLLFVPGNSERKLEKGLASGADALIVDLEDSVAPQDKADARTIAASFIAAARAGPSPTIIARVNDLASGLIDHDLEAVVAARPDAIMLPKATGYADIDHLSARLRVHEAEAGLADGSTWIVPIVSETAAAVLAAPSFDRPHARLRAMTWGAEDLSASLGARATRDGRGRYTDVFRLARTLTLLAASASEAAAIDTVYVDFRDEDGLRSECVAAERDGFTGKLAIHPGQVGIINEVFTPSAASVDEAAEIVHAFEAAGNPGVLAIRGKMVDIPHLKRARRLLARAGR